MLPLPTLMQSFAAILAVTIPVYLTMGIGGLLRRLQTLPQEVDKGMMRLAVTVLTPSLILDRVVGNEAVMRPVPVLVAAALGFTLVALGTLISWIAAPLASLRVGSGRRTFAMASGLQNYGFIAIPIVTVMGIQLGHLLSGHAPLHLDIGRQRLARAHGGRGSGRTLGR